MAEPSSHSNSYQDSSGDPNSYQEPSGDPNSYQEPSGDPNSYQEPSGDPNSYPNVHEEPKSDHGTHNYHEDDASNPISYIRDPKKVIAYLVPFPKPNLTLVDPSTIPDRFLIYTPPPPPLVKPDEGEKEGKIHKVQRKWQKEIRDAKTSTAKTMSWKGIKSKTLRGVSWATDRTTSSNLDFLGHIAEKDDEVHIPKKKDKVQVAEKNDEVDGAENDEVPVAEKDEVPVAEKDEVQDDGEHENDEVDGAEKDEVPVAEKDEVQDDGEHENDGVVEEETTKKTVGVEELVLVYPSQMGLTEQQIREEFVNTMLRTKSKAQREAIIAGALLPVTFGIDILASVVWPFGGLGEIDLIWAYTSFRGAKTARSVTKRLSSASDGEQEDEGKLQLTFRESERIQVLVAYLLARCHERNETVFPAVDDEPPTEEQVLSAIGWSPSEREKNWEDEQWEKKEVELDLKNVMRKGSKEWVSWCKSFARNPKHAVKK